jgi:hypothetical protein
MALSPAHYLARIQQPSEPTAAMRLGSLVHAIAFAQPWVLWPGRRAGKEWEAFAEKHTGSLIATPSESEKALDCVESLRASRVAAPLLKGSYEHLIEWSWMGRACSSRLDVLGDQHVVELKTASSTQPDRFKAACMGRLAYHAQLAFYRMAAGLPTAAAYIIGVETSAPFAVTVLRLTPRALLEGEKLCRLWFERLRSCEESGEWPAYSQCVLDLDVTEDDELIFDDPESPEEAA